MAHVIENLVTFYEGFSQQSLAQLADIYDDEVVFEDPIVKVRGLSQLSAHFASTMEGLTSCSFRIIRVQQGEKCSMLEWDMHFSHPRLAGGKPLVLNGVSMIEVDGAKAKVTYHRDYYDMGQMLYENIPVLNVVIRYIKRKLGGR